MSGANKAGGGDAATRAASGSVSSSVKSALRSGDAASRASSEKRPSIGGRSEATIPARNQGRHVWEEQKERKPPSRKAGGASAPSAPAAAASSAGGASAPSGPQPLVGPDGRLLRTSPSRSSGPAINAGSTSEYRCQTCGDPIISGRDADGNEIWTTRRNCRVHKTNKVQGKEQKYYCFICLDKADEEDFSR